MITRIDSGKTYSFGNHTLIEKVFADASHKLHLFLRTQSGDGSLDNTTEGNFVYGNKAVIVHICEEAHDELAVHTIRHSAVTGNRVAKILDLKGPLKAGGKESTEWSNEGCESGKDEDMDLHRCHRERLVDREPDWQVVRMSSEDWVRSAFKSCPRICAKILCRFSLGT